MNDMSTATDTKPDAPDGMTYNRKGVLVKKRASPNRATKIYAVMRVCGDQGIVPIDRKNVEVIATFRNSDKVLELLDSDEYEGAFFVRLEAPAGR